MSLNFDGVYLGRPAFDAQVSDQQVTPFVVHGEFKADKVCGELTPVLWLLLTRYGVAVRGPSPSELNIAEDPEALRRYNLENLRDFWRPLADKIRAQVANLPSTESVEAESLVLAMLGPARLHYTLMYGDIVSKVGAASHVAVHFSTWVDLAERAARSRNRAAERATVADLLVAADAIEKIADDAWRKYGGTRSVSKDDPV